MTLTMHKILHGAETTCRPPMLQPYSGRVNSMGPGSSLDAISADESGITAGSKSIDFRIIEISPKEIKLEGTLEIDYIDLEDSEQHLSRPIEVTCQTDDPDIYTMGSQITIGVEFEITEDEGIEIDISSVTLPEPEPAYGRG